MTEVVYSRLPEVIDQKWLSNLIVGLPEQWRGHVEGFRHIADQARSAEGRNLLLQQAKTKFGEKLNPSIAYTHGKPHLATHPHFHFNISHSAEYVVFASSTEAPIGVDVEKHRAVEHHYFTPFMSPDEMAYLQKVQFNEIEFFQWWTRKEALVKAIGKGLRAQLSTMEVLSSKIELKGRSYSITSRQLEQSATCSVVHFGEAPPLWRSNALMNEMY